MKNAKRISCIALALLILAAMSAVSASAENLGYIPNNGDFAGIPAEYSPFAIPLSTLEIVESSNTVNETNPQGQPTTVGTPYGKPDDVITIGEKDVMFFDGLGMHPKDPAIPVNGNIESYTIYDIGPKSCNRFYAALGITNPNGKNGNSPGVIYRVYGDYEGNGDYTLIAQSDVIYKKGTGEFYVDISGVRVLKLAVLTAGNAHTSSACAWADAAIYATADYEGPAFEPLFEKDEPAKPAPKPIVKPESEDTGITKIAIISAVAALVLGAGIMALIPVKKKAKKTTETNA